MRPVDPTWPLGNLPVDLATGIAPGIDVITHDGVRPMVWLTGWLYIVARVAGKGETWGIDFDPAEWAFIRQGTYIGPPIVDGYLLTSPAAFAVDTPAPPGPAFAPGADGVGPALDGKDGPTQWIVLDGYAYHVSDADTGRFQVRELCPEAHDAPDLPPFGPDA